MKMCGENFGNGGLKVMISWWVWSLIVVIMWW